MRVITQFGILLFTACVVLSALNERKCEHVFVSIEQAEIKIEQFGLPGDHEYTELPTGKREGQELICVKCFHKQKQVIDYGEAWYNKRDHPCNYFDMKYQIGVIIQDTVKK